jgi:hypothetical protein
MTMTPVDTQTHPELPASLRVDGLTTVETSGFTGPEMDGLPPSFPLMVARPRPRCETFGQIEKLTLLLLEWQSGNVTDMPEGVSIGYRAVRSPVPLESGAKGWGLCVTVQGLSHLDGTPTGHTPLIAWIDREAHRDWLDQAALAEGFGLVVSPVSVTGAPARVLLPLPLDPGSFGP